MPDGYSNHQPSVKQWLRDAPDHWATRRIRTVAEMRVSNVDKHTREGEIPVRLCNYVDVYKNDRITQQIPFMRATASEEEIDKFKLNRNDVVITKDSETWDDIGVPALVTEPADDLISGYHLAILRPRADTYGPYLFWILQSKPTAYQFHAEAKGVTRYGLGHHGIQSALVPHPPLPEQDAIARFLDHASEQIQRYVANKEQLIALLEEQRQAIIHQAVTRGLDPNVRLKPSGVEWLGDVPEHWEVMPLKRAFVSMDYGISDSGSQTGGVRLLTMGNIRDGSVTVPSTGGVTAIDQSLLLEKNDLLFNRTNSAELVAKVGLFSGHDSPVTFASYLVRIRSRSSNEPEYLNMALNETTFLAQARREAVPSLHQSNLNPTRYGRIHISLPPKEEQKTILSALAEKTNGLTTSMELAHRQIELIEEYRTRLIADVVTGKLDVREAAEELPQPEPA